LVVTLHPTIAHYNGTLRWDPAVATRRLELHQMILDHLVTLANHLRGNKCQGQQEVSVLGQEDI